MVNVFVREPALIVSLVSAVIALAVAFGLKLTQPQTEAIMGLATLVAGIVTRGLVTPNASATTKGS